MHGYMQNSYTQLCYVDCQNHAGNTNATMIVYIILIQVDIRMHLLFEIRSTGIALQASLLDTLSG